MKDKLTKFIMITSTAGAYTWVVVGGAQGDVKRASAAVLVWFLVFYGTWAFRVLKGGKKHVEY